MKFTIGVTMMNEYKEALMNALDIIKDSERCRGCTDRCLDCEYFLALTKIEGAIYGYCKLKEREIPKMVDGIPTKVGEWIPVEEGLQKKYNGFYEINLVTLENRHVCFGVYRYDSNEWWTRMSEGETVYSNKHKVIAWMPLPEPYIKEEK